MELQTAEPRNLRNRRTREPKEMTVLLQLPLVNVIK